MTVACSRQPHCASTSGAAAVREAAPRPAVTVPSSSILLRPPRTLLVLRVALTSQVFNRSLGLEPRLLTLMPQETPRSLCHHQQGHVRCGFPGPIRTQAARRGPKPMHGSVPETPVHSRAGAHVPAALRADVHTPAEPDPSL